MNKQKKKQIVKQKEKKLTIFTGNKEIDKLIKVYILVIIIFFVFWGITYTITNFKKSSDTKQPTPTTIQYSKIMVGTILGQQESSYYVLVEEKDDFWNATYEYYLSTYQSKNTASKYYVAELGNSFNKPYYTDQSNLNVSNIADIKFKQTTLLKISDKKIVEAYEGNENILNHLKNIFK